MLSKKSIEAMAAKLGIDITAALAAEVETDINIPEVTILGVGESAFTPAQLTARDNIKYNEGKDAGEEMAVKAVKEANGLSFTGKKVEGLFKHLQEVAKPDDSDVVKALRNNLTAAEQAKEAAISQMANMEKSTFLHSNIPQLNNGMTPKEAIAIWQANGYDVKKEGEAWKVYKDGAPVKDAKMLSDVPPTEAITGFFTERKFVGAVAPEVKTGRGAGNSSISTGVAAGSIAEIEKAWVEQNGEGSTNSSAYATHLESRMKEAADAGQDLK